MISTTVDMATSSAVLTISEADKVKMVVGEIALEVLATIGLITIIYLLIRGLLSHRVTKVKGIK